MASSWANETESDTQISAEMIQLFRDVSIVKCFIVASAALFLYDTFLILPAEVKFIWRSKWGIGKVLYLVTRYPAFIDSTFSLTYWTLGRSMDKSTCSHIFHADAWLFLLGTYASDAILTLRTYALWEKSNRVLLFLLFLTHAVIITQIVNLHHFLSTVKFIDTPAPSILPCNAVLHRTILYLNFALVVMFEFVIVMMTFWKGLEQWRQCRSPVMSTLYRDSVLIFVCLFAVSTTNLLIFLLADINMFYDLLVLSQRVLHAILSARVVLHLRIAASCGKDSKFTTMAFIEPSDVNPLANMCQINLNEMNDTESATTSTSSNNTSNYTIETEYSTT